MGRKMQAARSAWRALCKHRRAEKRLAAKMQAAADREARKVAERARSTEKRSAAKAARSVERAARKAEQKVRKVALAERIARPRGRPPSPPKRDARWTDYEPGHARRVYHAIRRGEIHPSTRSIAQFLGQHWNTVNNWRHRHPVFDHAIARGYEDRARLRGAILSCRRETTEVIDPAKPKFNHAAKTERGLCANIRVNVEFDHERHEMLVRGGHLKTHMRRRWHDCPPPPAHRLAKVTASQRQQYLRRMAKSPYVEAALGVVEGGARSNRQIARGLFIAESTLRLWRRNDEALDRAIREHLADAEHERAWRRVAWQVAREMEALAMADAYTRGIIHG